VEKVIVILAIDTALAFWNLLLPTGLTGGALKRDLTGEDVNMDGEESSGWTDEHTQWWFQFLTEKGGKGVSKDTWMMVRGQTKQSGLRLIGNSCLISSARLIPNF
jgi:hypothetical protein